MARVLSVATQQWVFLCRHEHASSFLLLSVERSSWQIVTNFSSKQRLHRLLAVLYALALVKMLHEVMCAMLLSFKVQMCLSSSTNTFELES